MDDFFDRSLKPSIRFQEGILNSFRWLISNKGTASNRTQEAIDKALDALSELYKLRDRYRRQ